LELDDSAKAAGIPADEVCNEFQPKPPKRRKPTCEYPCLWPKETEKEKCPLTFESYASSVNHVRAIHDPNYPPPRRKIVARLSKGTVPGPKAGEEKCDQKFIRWKDAEVHVRTVHHDPYYKYYRESITWPWGGPNSASSAKYATLPPSFISTEVERDGLSGS
jgi:hypothetical protein